MKFIQLTKGHVAIVDDEDYDRINAHKWQVQHCKRNDSYYAIRIASSVSHGKRCKIYMHREVMNAKVGDDVDHIMHNTLDQRKANLRLCTTSQNQANTRIQSNNTSGFKGVSWDKLRNKWRSYVNINGKQKHAGRYSTATEAAMAYDKLAVKYHGEFALTNAALGLLK